MARHPTSSRVHRDSSKGSDDAFVSGVERTTAWARKHQRSLIIGAVAVIVGAAVVLYYVNYQRTIENQAAARLTELQGTIASGNVQLALRDLQAFVNRFGSTEAGAQARLVLAELLLEQDQAPQVADALGALPDNLDDPLGIPAARLQAAAFEATGESDRAVDLYLRIADAARFEYEAREALTDAARVRLQNGNAEAAADLYERIVDTFEADEQGRGYYEMWLAEARAQSAEGGEAGPVTPDTAAAAAAETPGG